MSDYEIPPPEPKEIDSKKWLELKDVMERATLRGHPYNDERCDNCLYYLDPDDLLLLAPDAADPRRRGLVVPVVGGHPRGQLTRGLRR